MTLLPAAFSLVVSLMVLASIWSWMYALRKLIARQPLLAPEPRTTPPWNLIDICMVFVLWVLLQLLAVGLLGAVDATNLDVASNPAAEPPDVMSVDSATLRWAIVLSGVASLLVCGLGGLLIVFRTGARWGTDLGLSLRHVGRDVAYGVIAFAMMAPIIYAIQLILVQWFPSEHPLVESFRANPTLGFYLVCVFSAAIVAPLFEEFVCRVLLQGLFERIAVSESVEQALFSSQSPRSEPGPVRYPSRSPDVPPAVPPAVSLTELDPNPYAPSSVIEAAEVSENANANATDLPTETLSLRKGAVPILISSLVFAGLHWSHGPDPIPLFVLALGLGYLYQRTHRILPCVVVHFLVNAVALAMLAISLVVK